VTGGILAGALLLAGIPLPPGETVTAQARFPNRVRPFGPAAPRFGRVLLGVAVTLRAARQYARNLRRLDTGEPWEPSTKGIGIALSPALSLLGLGMVTYLITVSR
jgi:hypothetical protein